MFIAINKGKAGRVALNGESVSWRELYQQSEDMVTAIVFSRLAYLSPATLQKLWSQLFPAVAGQCGQLVSIEFWPSFYTSDNDRSSDNKRVEPDVVMHFSELTLIVEAKRVEEDNWQYAQQWQQELEATAQSYSDKPLALFAIGGLGHRSQQQVTMLKQQLPLAWQTVPVNGMSWQQFYQVITDFSGTAHPGEAMLFCDVCDAMAANGLATFREMASLSDWLAQEKFSLSESVLEEFARWKM